MRQQPGKPELGVMTIEPGIIAFASGLCPFAVNRFYKQQ